MVELSPSFETECEMIDRDHQRLIDMINHIGGAIDDDKAEECAVLVPEFVAFAKRHFAREEALLASLGYPDMKKHQLHHRSLNEKMDSLLELSKSAPDNPLARETLRKELVFFVMDDVINADLDFKAYVAGKKAPGQ